MSPLQRLSFRKVAKWLPVITVFGLILAACGPTEAPPVEVVEEAPPVEEEAPPVEEEEIEEAPVAAPEADETIVVSLSTDINLLEPHLFRSTGSYAVTRALYQPLLDQVFAEQGGVRVGTPETVPSPIIESFEEKADGSFVFTVNSAAKFANGDSITAEDIVYTFVRSIEAERSYIPLLLPFIAIDAADQFQVIDQSTFTITPTQPTALFNRFMTFQVFGPIQKSLAEEQGTADDPWAFDYFTTEANASGPYTLVSWDQAQGEVVLAPNPGWPGEIANDGIIVRNIPDAEERALLLQSGEIDVAAGLPPRLLAELGDDPAVNVYTAPSSRINYLGMNVAIPPLDNKLVRQAISWAIPYQALLDQVMFGLAQTAGTLITSPMETYQGEAAGIYTTDLDKARDLLEQSGVGEISLELGVRSSRSQDQQAAVFIQDNLRQIGIDVTINVLPDAEYSARQNARELPLSFHEWFSWGDDPFYQLTFLATCGSFVNFTGNCNEELDEIVASGKFETDPARRDELSLRAQEIMIDEAARAYLWAADWTLATRAEVTNVTKDFTEVPRFETLNKEE